MRIKKYQNPSGALEASNESEFKATPLTSEEYKNRYLKNRPFNERYKDFIISNGANGLLLEALLDFDVFASRRLGSFRKPWLGRFVDKVKNVYNRYDNWRNTYDITNYPWWGRSKVSQEEIDALNEYNEKNARLAFTPKFKYGLDKYSKATLDYTFDGIINNHDLLQTNPEYSDYWRSTNEDLKNKQFYVGDLNTGTVGGYYNFSDKKARVALHPIWDTRTIAEHELLGHGTEEYLSNNLKQPYKDFLHAYNNPGTKDWGEIRASTMELRKLLIKKATRFRPWRRRNAKVIGKFMLRSLEKMSDEELDKRWKALNGYTRSYDINSGYIKDLRNLLTNAYKCGGVIRKLKLGGVPYDLEETTVTPSRNGVRTNSKTSNVQGNPEPAPAKPSVPNVIPTVNATSQPSTVKHTVRPLQNSASEMPWYAPRQSHKPEEPTTEPALEVTYELTQEDQARQRLKALGYTDEEIDRMLNGSLEVVEEPLYRSTEGLTRGEFRTKDAKYYKPEELYDWLQKEYFRVTDIDDIDSMRTYNLVNYSILGVFGDEFKNWFSDNHLDLVQKLYNSAAYQFDQTIAPYKDRIKFIGTTTTGSPTYSKANNTIYFNPSLEYLQELKELIQEIINNQNAP